MIKKFLNSKFKKDLSFSYIAQFITVSFGFVQLFLINRYFGVEIFGQLAIIGSTAGIFSSLLTAKSSEAITRFFTREMLNNNFENAKLILFIGFVIDFITAIFLILIIYLFSNLIATTFIKDENLNMEVFMYSFIIFFGFLRGTLFGYFQSKEMFNQINSISIIESILKILILILTILMIKDNSLIQIIYIFIFVSFFSLLYSARLFYKHYKKEFHNIAFKYNKSIVKEYWSFNIKTFISSSLKSGNNEIDILVLSYFTNSITVGIYSILKKVVSPINMLITPFSNLSFPKIVQMYELKYFLELRNYILKKTKYLISIILISLFILFILLEYIFSFMNIDYQTIYEYPFLFLAIVSLIASTLWWWRAFIITHNPGIPIMLNIINLFNSIAIPIFVFNYFSDINQILLISISNFLVTIPMLIIAYYFFYNLIYKGERFDKKSY